MSENAIKNERLIEGETTYGPTTDEAITERLSQITREVGGLADPTVVIEGESYPPRLISNGPTDIAEESSLTEILQFVPSMKPSDSKLGLTIWSGRVTKKAA